MKTTAWVRSLLGVGLLLSGLRTLAQTPVGSPVSVDEPATAATVDGSSPAISSSASLSAVLTVPGYCLEPGDVVAVRVLDMAELNRNEAVGPRGNLDLPYLRYPLPAAGHTVAATARQVRSELQKEQIAIDPQVEVMVLQVRSHPVTVLGEVRRPGVLEAVVPLTLLDAVLLAGGPTPGAGDLVTVTRPAGTSGGASSTRTVSLTRLLEGSDPRLNFRVHSGDLVRVLPAGQVYVAGDVDQSGAFPLRPGAPLTIARILSLTHGWKADASPDKAVLVRTSSSGGVIRIPVNLAKIVNHRAPDLRLQANDILFVPGSGVRGAGIFAVKGVAASALLAVGYLLVH